MRSAIVLEVAKGGTVAEVARSLNVHPATVERWCSRFLVNRLDGIRRQAPRSSTRMEVPWRTVERILELSRSAPPAPSNRWTTRLMAKEVSVSHMFVHRVWKSHRIRPTEPPSPPPSDRTAEPYRTYADIVGVYDGNGGRLAVFEIADRLSLPNFLAAPIEVGSTGISGGVFSDRQEIFSRFFLPLLSVLEEGDKDRPASTQENFPHDLLIFLRTLEYQVPSSSNLWLVSDGLPLAGSGRLSAWLRMRPRFHLHPLSGMGSWEEEIRRWAAQTLPERLHPSSFPSVASCHASIARCLSEGRDRHRPFAWTLAFDSLRGWGPIGSPPTPPARPSETPRRPGALRDLSFRIG
jgi:transposase-like protein